MGFCARYAPMTRWITFLLVLGLTPAVELVEVARDSIHQADASDRTPGHAEHGCTALTHACSCHVGVSALAPTGVVVTAPPKVRIRMIFAVTALACGTASLPLLRPPIRG